MALALYTVQGTLIVIGVATLAIVLRRMLPAMWRSWVWGALAFVSSQVVRQPLLIALTLFLQQTQLIPRTVGSGFVFWLNLAVLALTSGLFEESARYLVLRLLGKESRGWNEAVMFGAGHGGIEAILLVGGAAVSNIYLLLNADMLLAQTRAFAPQQAAALARQITALRGVTPFLIGASLWERVFAIMLHIGLSVLAMRAVETHALKWVGVAMLIHALSNAVVIVAQRYGGVVGAEAAVAVIGLAMLGYTLAGRRASAARPRTPV